MCACRQKKASFFIKDILCEGKDGVVENGRAKEELQTRYSELSVVQRELEATKLDVNIEQRRNTYPIYPTPIKPSYPWSYKTKGFEQRPLYSEPILNSEMLRSQLSMSRFGAPAPFSLRPPYSFDRVPCFSPWWGMAGRRKGGQVRFSAAQTGALERRFNANKYLSPDERRALASSLRLSDRQVKTWFQNRRAKWRRTTLECADLGSSSSVQEDSDDDVLISDP
ncbi:unnamed protein product [Leptosia nina]|uniref:Homeobox domain-containing protein n=1 Tax=Leptosia nina TaxID=320188 RepID=A0AAV1JBE4_9NEOP